MQNKTTYASTKDNVQIYNRLVDDASPGGQVCYNSHRQHTVQQTKLRFVEENNLVFKFKKIIYQKSSIEFPEATRVYAFLTVRVRFTTELK